MTYSKIFSMCAALAATMGGLVVMAPSASAKERPVVVVAPETEAPTRRVSYTNLNLATTAGEKMLYHRVGQAVRVVCNESVGSSPSFYAEVACQDFAWKGARPQIKRAVQRASEIAANGSSLMAVQAITIAVPK